MIYEKTKPTPKEKAKKLVETYLKKVIELAYAETNTKELAKESALICVNELLDTVPYINNTQTEIRKRMYYMDVREEIRNL